MKLKRKLAVGASAALLATGAVVVSPSAVDAGIVDTECFGSNTVGTGELLINGAPLNPYPDPDLGPIATNTSQGILDLLGAFGDPKVPGPVSIEAQVQVSSDPSSFAPGVQDVSFFVTLILPDSLTQGLVDMGLTEVDLSGMQMTLTPGTGVSGDPLVINPPDATVDLLGAGFPTTGPYTASFDVTGANGSEVGWDLTQSTVGFQIAGDITDPLPASISIRADELTCTAAGNPVVAGLVVDPNGPVVPGLQIVTPQDTPGSVDILAAVSDGPAAPNDPSSLAITELPSNGSVALANGVATYTPNAGYVGNDQFTYQICTEDFLVVAGQNQIDEVTVDSDNGFFDVTVFGETVAGIPFNADAATVQAAIESLSTVGAGNVAVSGGPGNPGGTTPYVIEWVGELSELDVTVAVDIDAAGGSIALAEVQRAQVEIIDSICNSGLVSVTVEAATSGGGGTTTTTTAAAGAGAAAAATPVSASPSFTG